MRKFMVLGAVAALVAGCQEFEGSQSAGFFLELPPEITEIAAPRQNLNAVRVNQASGCYEFQHVGPVETTFLPLRTKNGNPICARAAAEG